jgi:hypothetical protein
MRVLCQWAGAALLLCTAVSCVQAQAEGFASGIPAGTPIGSYSGVKSGGVDDGVENGKSLCYT